MTDPVLKIRFYTILMYLNNTESISVETYPPKEKLVLRSTELTKIP